jgi:hypothetical protein
MNSVDGERTYERPTTKSMTEKTFYPSMFLVSDLQGRCRQSTKVNGPLSAWSSNTDPLIGKPSKCGTSSVQSRHLTRGPYPEVPASLAIYLTPLRGSLRHKIWFKRDPGIRRSLTVRDILWVLLFVGRPHLWCGNISATWC